MIETWAVVVVVAVLLELGAAVAIGRWLDDGEDDDLERRTRG